MNITFHTNCQGWGLHEFFRWSPDAGQFDLRIVQNYRICTGEETREQETAAVERADILFYHATQRQYPWLPTVSLKSTVRMIPISVFFQGAYFFMENAHRPIWQPALDLAKAHGVDHAAAWLVNEADLGYAQRWMDDLAYMQRKEVEEGVDEAHRLTGLQQDGLVAQMFLTKNHPSSIAFLRWANLLLNYIGFRPLGEEWEAKCLANPNLVNLPCEDWITTAARNHLHLPYGATEYENRRSMAFAKDKLNEWLNEDKASTTA